MELKVFYNPPHEWDEFVKCHPYGRIYHLSQWNELIRNYFKHPIKYIVLENTNSIEGVLPLTEFKSMLFGKYSVSLPFINYGGPLINSASQFSIINKYLIKYQKQSNFDFIELRMETLYETPFHVKQHKVTFLIDLPDNSEELFNSFKSKVRNQIRRPLKEAMYCKVGLDNLLNDFYRVYSINMRDLGTPALPKSFFRNILKTFPDNVSIVCVYTVDHKATAASFLIHYNDVCEIPWASSLKQYNKFSPNMLLYWESFKTAIEKGCKQFDMGRCSRDSGTYKFKQQWGAQEKPLFWYYVLSNSKDLPELNPNNRKYSLLIKTWKKLPVIIANSLSPLIIKDIP
jgi:FemAB-related protein (PEP-CTERM system-associated)